MTIPSLLRRLPPGLVLPAGRRLPYRLRLGPLYTQSRHHLQYTLQLSDRATREFVFKQMQRMVNIAYHQNTAYRTHYQRHRFTPDALQRYSDIVRIPDISRQELQEFSLPERTSQVGPGVPTRRRRVNTGGSSGTPLAFYAPRDIFATEWAHMHHIWSKLGYRISDARLTLRGHELGAVPYRYKAETNEFVLNTYISLEVLSDTILSLLRRYRAIRFIHGYPSAIYRLAEHAGSKRPDLALLLAARIDGIFLGSENPIPRYRRRAEEIFECRSISWYGHSEMAVLAAEANTEGLYIPYISYGHAEALATGSASSELTATGFFNTISPFIRYRTGDLIEANTDEGLLSHFSITEGRIGEFVLDTHGNAISLTGLVFGRHHPLFDVATHVQVQQDQQGHLIIMAVPRPNYDPNGSTGTYRPQVPQKLLNLSGLDMDAELVWRQSPFRTASGKTPLLVPFNNGPNSASSSQT